MRFSQAVRQMKVWLLAAGAAMAMTSVASAQFGEAAGIAEAMQPDYLSRDMKLFQEGLQLDEAQRVIIEALFRDYDAAFEAGLEQIRKRFENMRSELGPGDTARVMKLVFAPFEEWGIEKQKLSEQFLQNVQVVLTAEQMEKWPSFERRLYREKQLRKGHLSGESLNLFHIIRDLSLDEKTIQQIQPLLDEYELALDEALRARQRAIVGPDNQMLESLQEQDAQKQYNEMERQVRLRIAIRNVNDSYLERIADALPEDAGWRFRQAALEDAYPRIYRPTPVQHIFTKAKALGDLDSGVIAAIEQIEAAYLAELDGMNRTILNELRNFEPKELLERAAHFNMRMKGQQVEKLTDPTRELFLRRDDLARTYAKQLQAILTPEQFAKLPGAFRWVDVPQQERSAPAAAVPARTSPSGRKWAKPGEQDFAPGGSE